MLREFSCGGLCSLEKEEKSFGARRWSWGLRRVHAPLVGKELFWELFLWILVLWRMIPQGILVLRSVGLTHKDVLDLTSVTAVFWSNARLSKRLYANPPAGRFGILVGTSLVIPCTQSNAHDPYIESFFILIHFLNCPLKQRRRTDLSWMHIHWDGIVVSPLLSL